MNIIDTHVCMRNGKTVDIVLEVEFIDERESLKEPYFSVLVEDNRIIKLTSDDGEGIAFGYHMKEEMQVRDCVWEVYSYR